MRAGKTEVRIVVPMVDLQLVDLENFSIFFDKHTNRNRDMRFTWFNLFTITNRSVN